MAPDAPPHIDTVELHRSLTIAVATGKGAPGIADVLHRVTGGTVVIDDGERTHLARAGDGLATTGALPAWPPSRHDDHAQAVRIGDWVLAVARPDVDCLGVIGLHDPGGRADDADLVAVEQGALVLATEMFRLRSVASNELRVWGDLAAELLDDPDLERTRSHAAALGYPIDRPHRAIVIHAPESGDLPSMPEVHRAFRAAGIDGRLTTQRTADIVCLVDAGTDPLALAAALYRPDAPSPRLGIGDTHDPFELGLSVIEAELALRLSGAVIVRFDDLGFARFLSADADLTRLQAFVDEWIGVLEEYDRDHDSDFVHTLSQHLRGLHSARATAERLHIHPSTLKYRMRRIEELTARDLHDPDARFSLDLACRIRSTLHARDLPALALSGGPPDSGRESAESVQAPLGRGRASAVVEVAVLDGDGVITSVNPAWTEFCTANGGDLARAGVGTSFLDVCAQASGDPWADLVASLVRLAVAGELPAPALLTVPCHSPDTSRWFDMTVASRHDDDGRCCGAKVTLTRTSVH